MHHNFNTSIVHTLYKFYNDDGGSFVLSVSFNSSLSFNLFIRSNGISWICDAASSSCLEKVSKDDREGFLSGRDTGDIISVNSSSKLKRSRDQRKSSLSPSSGVRLRSEK